MPEDHGVEEVQAGKMGPDAHILVVRVTHGGAYDTAVQHHSLPVARNVAPATEDLRYLTHDWNNMQCIPETSPRLWASQPLEGSSAPSCKVDLHGPLPDVVECLLPDEHRLDGARISADGGSRLHKMGAV